MEGAPIASRMFKLFHEGTILAIYVAWVLAWLIADCTNFMFAHAADFWIWMIRLIVGSATFVAVIVLYFLVQTIVLLGLGKR